MNKVEKVRFVNPLTRLVGVIGWINERAGEIVFPSRTEMSDSDFLTEVHRLAQLNAAEMVGPDYLGDYGAVQAEAQSKVIEDLRLLASCGVKEASRL